MPLIYFDVPLEAGCRPDLLVKNKRVEVLKAVEAFHDFATLFQAIFYYIEY
jgi:hypothetical protein